MDIEYLLLFLMRLHAFVCSLFSCLLFLCLSSSFILTLGATCYLIIMHVSTSLDKNFFTLHFHKR